MKTEMLWNEIFRLKEHGVSESQDARLEEGITGGCGQYAQFYNGERIQ